MAKKTHGIAFKIAAILGGLLVVLLISEIGLRVIGALTAEPPVEPIPPGEPFSISKLEVILASLPNDPNRIRILFLGDSFTYGTGVEPNQGLVPKVDQLLEQRAPGHYLTIRLGIPGADPIREWALYNRARDTARADVVVQVIAPNDLDFGACTDLFAIQEFQARRLWTSRHLALSMWIERKIRCDIGARRFINYLKGGAEPEERDRAWRIFSQEISHTKRLAEEGGATYAMVRFPLLSQLEDYPLEDDHRRGAAVAADLKIPYLDLLDAFRGQSSRSMTLRGDPHPNAAAYTIAARAITDFLMQSVLPKLPARSTSRSFKPRSSEEITAAEIRHHRDILEREPNCIAARFWLERVLTETTGQHR